MSLLLGAIAALILAGRFGYASLDSKRFPNPSKTNPSEEQDPGDDSPPEEARPSPPSRPAAAAAAPVEDDNDPNSRKRHRVCFFDMNNSDEEFNACNSGVRENNPDDCTGDSDDCVVRIRGSKGHPIGPKTVENKIAELAAKNEACDMFLMSGHDGNGHFFGQDDNSIRWDQLRDIVKKYPIASESLRSVGLWGCYTTNKRACDTYWMHKIGPKVSIAMGFPLQSPDNTVRASWHLLHDYCKTRNEPVDASDEASIEEYARRLKTGYGMNYAICTDTGICSMVYKRPNDTSGKCFHSSRELKDRCDEYDPDGHPATKEYYKYLEPSEGDEAKFDDPPEDKTNVFTSSRETTVVKSPIRSLADQVHKWGHCKEDLEKSAPVDDPFKMPEAARVIRLVKFADFKKNLMKMHGGDIADFNERMEGIGLSDYTLDPEHQTRKELINRTHKGFLELRKMYRAGGPDSDTARKLYYMAMNFDLTIRQLDPSCSHFSWVHESNVKSACILPYGVVPEWAKPKKPQN